MARSNPIIWDGVLAISVLYEHPQWAKGHGAESPDHDIVTDPQTMALKFYNRAIFRIRNQTTHTVDDISSALMSCILFTCIEFLQDSTDQLPLLYQAGYKLLQDNPLALDRLDSSLVGPADIREVILPMFTRLGGLATLASGPQPRIFPTPNIECLSGTTTLAEARCRFYPLLDHMYGCIIAASRYLLLEETDLMIRTKIEYDRDTLYSVFVEFHDAFLKLFERQNVSIEERVGVQTFLMHCELIAIWLPLCLEPDKMCWDRCFVRFNEIVKRGTFVVQANSQRSIKRPQIPFVFDEGVMAPLSFTANHCRHPRIRREALALLKQGPEKESIWKAWTAVHNTSLLIELEEQGLEKSSVVWDGRGKGLEFAGDDVVQLPEEKSRVSTIHGETARHGNGQMPSPDSQSSAEQQRSPLNLYLSSATADIDMSALL